jgi:hypothetical protein
MKYKRRLLVTKKLLSDYLNFIDTFNDSVQREEMKNSYKEFSTNRETS